jgi:hypothetical protein
VTTTQDEKLDALRREMNAARDAWMALMGHGNTPELIAAAKVAARLEGEYRLAKMGKLRRIVPAGRVECPRCGGFGGSSQWPGFMCFGCDGLGHVDPT